MSEIAALRSQRRWMDSFFIAEGFYRAVFIGRRPFIGEGS
jgi:hypothetical protein